MPLTIAIVGGGAAGFFAAIAAAEVNRQARVVLFEKSPEFLAKVAISGGGRCNVTHACFDVDRLISHYPRGGRELIGPFHRFQPRDTVEWFAARGIKLKVEEDGRMFPATDRSSTIVTCLLRSAARAGVSLRASSGVSAVVRRAEGGFVLRLPRGESFTADRVLLATGGNRSSAGYMLAESLGHTIEPPVPSLFGLHVPDPEFNALAGISVPSASVAISGGRFFRQGPVLITHSGLSGPAVLRLSAWAARELAAQNYCTELEICWQTNGPLKSTADIDAIRRRAPARRVAGTRVLDIPARLWHWLCARAGIPADRTWSRLTRAEGERLLENCLKCRISTAGKSLNKEEFVTCGGVRLSEVDFRTMESKRCPGLFFAGELLDIDAETGGFNLQAAWTTGWIAGHAIAREHWAGS